MRVVSFASIASDVRSSPPQLGPVRLVCVDGPAGSGKSTLAGRLSNALDGCQVIHMDDLYEGWHGLGKVWDRLEHWVLAPLRAGRPARYRRYDWDRETFAEWHPVPLASALIIEGVGSADRPIDPEAVLKIWVEAPRSVRFDRGIERDGEGFRPYWEMWAAQEDEHFAEHGTRDRADLIVIGDPTSAESPLPHDPDAEIVVR